MRKQLNSMSKGYACLVLATKSDLEEDYDYEVKGWVWWLWATWLWIHLEVITGSSYWETLAEYGVATKKILTGDNEKVTPGSLWKGWP